MVALEKIVEHYSRALMEEFEDLHYGNGNKVFSEDQLDLYRIHTENVIVKALCDVQICIITGNEWEAPKS